MRSTERPHRAVLLGLLLLGLLGALGAAPAAAQRPVEHAWTATGPLAPAVASEDRIYVSQAGGQEQARSFVRVDGSAVELRRAELTLVEGSGGLRSDTGELQACAMTGPVTGSGKVEDAPDADCETRVPVVRVADGRWTVALGALADALEGAAAGWFAVTPAEEAAAPAFTVAFDTSATELRGVQPGEDAGSGAPAPAAPPPATPDTAGEALPPPIPEAAPTFLPDGPLLSDPAVDVPPSARVEPTPAPARPVRPAPDRNPRGSAAEPPAVILLLVAAVAAVVLWARGRWLPPVLAPGAAVSRSTLASSGALAAVAALVLLLSEAAVYKLGFIGIVFIAAIGLHILVNWAGELSLAHASFVGLPAFMVAQLTHHTGWTPIVFLPVGVAAGAALGLLVAIPARRARGLQVALVTLAVGIASTQFLFVRSWVIGPPSGLEVPVPSLLGIRFETSRSLLPVLLVVLLVAVVVARAVLSSTIGRALSQVRAVPDAAAIAGVPVATYRVVAYGLAGAFAGLAGGAYVLWVQRVGPQAFPLNLGFTYLVIATLAGKGGLTGVAIAAVALEGGRLFSIIPESIGLYLGPIALIYNVTRYQEGINGAIRDIGRRLRARKEKSMEDRTEQRAPRAVGAAGTAVRLPVVVAGVLVAVGFAAIGLAWYHAGNTDQLWIQNQELLSGGFGGGGLIVLGAALLIRDALLHGPAARRAPTADD